MQLYFTRSTTIALLVVEKIKTLMYPLCNIKDTQHVLILLTLIRYSWSIINIILKMLRNFILTFLVWRNNSQKDCRCCSVCQKMISWEAILHSNDKIHRVYNGKRKRGGSMFCWGEGKVTTKKVKCLIRPMRGEVRGVRVKFQGLDYSRDLRRDVWFWRKLKQ